MIMSESPNTDAIINMLTLRYNPLNKPLIPKLSWPDFVPKKTDEPVNKAELLIKKHTEDSVRKGKFKKIVIALSSGIDSVLILVMLREVFPEIDIQCVSASFNDSLDETGQAAEIARQCNADYKSIQIENPLRDLPMLVNMINEPRWNLYWYYVVKEASSLSNVIFTGDGGDELFGGYTFRYKKFLDSIASNNSWKDRVWVYLNCHERDWVPDQERLFGVKVKFSWSYIINILEPYFNNELGPLNQVFLADFNGKLLYDWIPTNTKMYEHFKIHCITPFLSKEIISFATHLPHELKYEQESATGKVILRKMLQTRKIYHKITKDKIGFGLDASRLWDIYGREIAEELLYDARIVKDGLINHEWIKLALLKLKETKDVRYINKMLGLIALETWYRLSVTREMNENTKL